MNSPGSGSRYHFPTGQRIVVTVPSWARNLPPDELSDDEDDPAHHDAVPSRPSGFSRRVSSAGGNGAGCSNPSSAGPSDTGSPTLPLIHELADASAPPAAKHSEGRFGGVPLIRHTSSSSGEPSSPAHQAIHIGPAAPEQAHSAAALRRANPGGAADKGWWTFTLPGKYLDRVHGYIHPAELVEKGKGRGRDRDMDARAGADDESDQRSVRSLRSIRSRLSRLSRRSSRAEGDHDVEKQDYHRKMRQNMHLRLAPPNVFAINQTTAPGWSTPWTPFRREGDAQNYQDPFDLSQNAAPLKRSRFETFMLRNPFSPLFLRTINLLLIGCTLGLAAHIRVQEVQHDVIGVIGTSTLFAIVVAPLAIVHIFVLLYIEYFGLPIGLWKIHTKMFHTLSELVFICLYSAILSLAFDDLFTSSLQCTSFTPYARYNSTPSVTQTAGVEGSLADSICKQQIAQVVFIFCSVIFYIVVLVISLFRIFAKVSMRNGRNA